jgi:hypothetical protein
MSERALATAQKQSTALAAPSHGAILQRKCACGNHTTAGSECEECKGKKGVLQRASTNGSVVGDVPSIVYDVLRSPGQTLDFETRAFMESRFGYDFSHVRVHTDESAARSARAVAAQAYTVGSHIAFSSGRYSPQSATGRQLLAHELTHVVQQSPTLARRSDFGSESVLQRKPAPSGTASERVNRLASLLETYAKNADAQLAASGKTSQVAPIRADLQELRGGIGRLRLLAQQGNEQASLAALSGFAPQHLRAASRVLVPISPAPQLVAVANKSPVALATKSLTVEGAETEAEVEAERVAAAIMSSQPVQVNVGTHGMSMQRLLDGAAFTALESELPVVAAETGVADVAATTAVTAGAVATEEAALGTAAVVAAAGGPPGWVIGLAIVAVVAIAAGAGYLYYRSRQTAAQPQPQAQPQAQPQTQTQSRTAPKECEENARKISTPDCRVTATLQHSGADPLADLFCEEKTNSPCEYRVEAASGRAFFDAIRGTDVYECKCGYQSLLDAIKRGERWAKPALDAKIEQIRRHLRVVKDCHLQYRIIVSNEAFARYLRQLFGDEIDIIVEEFEPCD